jgi:hypothetical protein
MIQIHVRRDYFAIFELNDCSLAKISVYLLSMHDFILLLNPFAAMRRSQLHHVSLIAFGKGGRLPSNKLLAAARYHTVQVNPNNEPMKLILIGQACANCESNS